MLGHDTIGTEHLLLALLADINPNEMRDHLRELTEHPQPHE
nr:Clp protease N-terminal domain-containing protein [Rhodococcus wratislaviensis]